MRRSGSVNDLSASAAREHALRNALNVLDLSLSIARDAMAQGDAALAADFIARAQQASLQCRRLFEPPPPRRAAKTEPA